MNYSKYKQFIKDVFAPVKGEKIVLLYDLPHGELIDNKNWYDRRFLVNFWFELFRSLSIDNSLKVEKKSFKAVGKHNGLLSGQILSTLVEYNIIIAMTEFSVTSSLFQLVKNNPDSIRCASMPCAEIRMMDTVFSMDYSSVKQYSWNLKKLLDEAILGRIQFSSGDELNVDLRNRVGKVDDGDCTCAGSFINLPSGEGFIAPYEAEGIEKKRYGISQTKGIIPLKVNNSFIKFIVEENKIIEILYENEKNGFFDKLFSEKVSRRNIAEFGIGCNPKAKVTGNLIEDEKVGMHIAYGTSDHIGGKVSSDLHIDLVYAKNCPIEAEIVTLYFKNRPSIDIITNGNLRYDIIDEPV